MIQIPYRLLIGGGVLLAILIGWFATYQSLKVAKANVAAAAEREARLVESVTLCQANRAEFEEKLDGIATDIEKVANSKTELQGALDDAVRRSRDIAAAREALERLRAEHADLVNRAVPLDECQTYEMVLAAFAGGQHVQ